jgi:hypothetical protein
MTAIDLLDSTRQDNRGGPALSPSTPEPDDHGGVGRVARWPHLGWLSRPESLITLSIVVVAVVFVFVQLQPSNLFSTSTPAGGDMGAHVWLPAYMRDHLLTHWRITGWTPDWYGGFPALVYYFPLPMLMVVAVNVVLPYTVAFKLVSVAGLVLLPLAAWSFGKLARMPFPGPACLAAATLPFLFSREFTIYGGNIASTLAGEFAFSISLAAAVIFLGLVARGMDTGKYRALAAIALTVTGLCHLLPTLFAVVGALVLTLIGEERTHHIGWPTRLLGGLTLGALLGHLLGLVGWDASLALAVLTLMAPTLRFDRRRWQWTLPVLVTAACLAAFWAIPFVFRLPYATDMGYEKLTAYTKNLFPAHLLWLFILAALGGFASFVRRQRIGMFLTIMAVLSALIFRFAPQARLWNARVLPFWFLCLYLLAGLAFSETGAILVEAVAVGEWSGAARWSLLAVPVVTALAAFIWVAFPLRILPFGHTNTANSQYTWLGIKSADRSFVPDWVSWNYSGYESNGKARKAEYFALIQTMAKLGNTDGCGRAMWEYEPEEDQMGTPMALMLLPYWTHSCIGSMEGLYFESSATTPYHFLNAAELSLKPSNPVRGLDYPSSPNVVQGVQHLQMLGVKYYMSLTPETQAQADADPDLKLVATSGPWPVTYYSGNAGTSKQRTWKIYEVEDSAIVSPLKEQPVVMKGTSKGGKTWLKPSEAWYLDPSDRDVFYAASGPKNWTRIASTDLSPPRTPLQPVQVANIKSGDDNVSFDVDTIGVPVLVKVSYFPNWHVSGAKGPYRVTPNLMVVIPTSQHVRLHYGYTSMDLIGFLLSLLGVAGVAWLFWAKPVHMPMPLHLATARAHPRPETDPSPAPFYRLEHELAGAFPPTDESRVSDQTDQDLDVWLGFPAGLDLARYRASDYGHDGRYGNGADQYEAAPVTGETPVGDATELIDPAWMGPSASVAVPPLNGGSAAPVAPSSPDPAQSATLAVEEAGVEPPGVEPAVVEPAVVEPPVVEPPAVAAAQPSTVAAPPPAAAVVAPPPATSSGPTTISVGTLWRMWRARRR